MTGRGTSRRCAASQACATSPFVYRKSLATATCGVAVAAYGTDAFPAFFNDRSDVRAPLRFDDPTQVAAWLAANDALGLTSGAILAVPNPAPMRDVDGFIEDALAEAARRRVTGKDATPFLLADLRQKRRRQLELI